MSSHPCMPDPGSRLPSAAAPPNNNNTNNNNNKGDISLNRMQLLCLAAMDPSCVRKAPSEEPVRSRGELESNPSAVDDETIHDVPAACIPSAAAHYQTQEIASSQWSHFILIMALSPHIAEPDIRSALSSSTVTKRSTESITFWGHVLDATDAHVLVEAVVAGVLPEFGRMICEQSGQGADELVCIRLGSGTVLVWEDSERLTRTVLAKNRRWSAPWRQGQFQLSRELDIHASGEKCIHNGFCKKWISVQASNGKRYLVISYFTPSDVAHLYDGQTIPFPSLKRPLASPHLAPFYVNIHTHLSSSSPRTWQFCDDSVTATIINSQIRPELKPFPIPEDLVLRQGVFQYHCVFQIDDPKQVRCPCGGLGPRKAQDYFRDDCGWMDRRPVLAPLLREPVLRKLEGNSCCCGL
ncbi:hypothetical protein BJ741DRAFT_593318 [Chytriomyces cf. hyalinus JEL632]|nr:hypothetical protein BJ741DRAFT_593318 [Chytriomyces cf. hyalinus JEL632]